MVDLRQSLAQFCQCRQSTALSRSELSSSRATTESQDARRAAVELKAARLLAVVERRALRVEYGVLSQAVVNVAASDKGGFRWLKNSGRGVIRNPSDCDFSAGLAFHPNRAGDAAELLAFAVNVSPDCGLAVKRSVAGRARTSFVGFERTPTEVAKGAEHDQNGNDRNNASHVSDLPYSRVHTKGQWAAKSLETALQLHQ